MGLQFFLGGVGILCCLAGCKTVASEAQPEDGLVQAWTRQSALAFEGRVEATRASCVKAVPANDSTVVVTLLEIYAGEAALTGQEGRKLTVLLAQPGALRTGQSAVFFANPSMYAEALVVSEIGHLDPSPERRRQIEEAQQRIADVALQERLFTSELVVFGEVVGTAEAPVEQQRSYLSEHDPQWRQAVLDVQSVEKGQAVGERVIVTYPASMDVRWYAVPKFESGRRGIWILRSERPAGLTAPVFTALNPQDFHPAEELERIRSLLGN